MRSLIIDDERLARKELRTLLEASPEIEIVGECANADEAREAIERENPDRSSTKKKSPGDTPEDYSFLLTFYQPIAGWCPFWKAMSHSRILPFAGGCRLNRFSEG